MEQMTEQDGSSLDIVSENLEALKSIFPDAFTEDSVNFETLKQLLGEGIYEGDEKYGLNWHGKKKARQIALTPSMGTLRPCREESVDWDTTQNLFIEGDNLEVLKLLQKSYAGKVKMIYIDPPYNTGKEFIYPDKFQENLDTYLKYLGLKSEDGVKLSSMANSRNVIESGRYHTNWLNMMFPRLKVARNLLNNEGVIFISIGDHEIANLRRICDEVFGDENFVASVIWQKVFSPKNTAQYFSEDHEYILVYAKDKDIWRPELLPRSDETIKRYTNPDDDIRGPWLSGAMQARNYYGKGMYEVTSPSGKKYSNPKGTYWRFSFGRFEELDSDNRIWWGKSGDNVPRLKRFLSEVKGGVIPQTLWKFEDVGHTQEAKEELLKYVDFSETENVLNSVKPSRLIKKMLQIGTKSNESDIVIDFFAGSGVTAQAVLEKNIEDKGNRRFILVQLPEPLKKEEASLKTIADLTKSRINTTRKMIRESEGNNNVDLGCKVFRLDSSNIQAWQPNRDDLENTLFNHTEHLAEGRSEEDVLYELLLKRGVDLSVPIEQKDILGKAVYSIGYGVLFACLDEAISRDDVEDLAQGIISWHRELEPASDTQVVFRDSAFDDDIAKTNMTAILQQNGIKHVRSL